VTRQPWTDLVARYSSLKESERLRITGTLVLMLGIAVAVLYYWSEVRPAPQTMNDLLPGYTRSQARGVTMLMGHTGVMMLEWQDALARAGTQAAIIAVVGALFSLYFFRAAWVLDDDERDAGQGKTDG
jgi:hypothetical protein